MFAHICTCHTGCTQANTCVEVRPRLHAGVPLLQCRCSAGACALRCVELGACRRLGTSGQGMSRTAQCMHTHVARAPQRGQSCEAGTRGVAARRPLASHEHPVTVVHDVLCVLLSACVAGRTTRSSLRSWPASSTACHSTCRCAGVFAEGTLRNTRPPWCPSHIGGHMQYTACALACLLVYVPGRHG